MSDVQADFVNSRLGADVIAKRIAEIEANKVSFIAVI